MTDERAKGYWKDPFRARHRPGVYPWLGAFC